MTPLYISFYTPDYAEAATRLRLSLIKYKCDFLVTELQSKGSWVANCNRKPRFIWEMMNQNPKRPVCWVDADAVLRKRPTMLDHLNCDCAFARLPRGGFKGDSRKYKWETLSGTVYVAPTTGGRKLVDRWICECDLHPQRWDQVSLRKALEELELEVAWQNLPVAYCYIADLHKREYPRAKAVIEHFQQSRKSR